MKNPLFEKIVSTKQAVIQGASLINHNKLLWRCEGVIGVKTGYTEASGRTLVSCARRGDTWLGCGTLNDSDDWDDHAALYNWGFESYMTLKAGSQKYKVPVVSGLSADVGVSCNEERSFFLKNDGGARIEVCLPKFCYAPVRKGDKAGELRIMSGNEVLGSIELVYDNNVPVDESLPLTFWERVKWYWYYANEHSIYNVYPMY
jgi:D-alanyl-D-alanine carboxypeptidase